MSELIDETCEAAAADSSVLTGLGIAVGLVGVLLISLVAACVLVLRTYWDRWYQAAVTKAFNAMDHDEDGRIHEDELYTGVLELYLTLHNMNVPCEAPSREVVLSILRERDADADGRLDYEEFRHVMHALTAQVFGRAALTLVFFVSFPLALGILYSLAVDWMVDNHVGRSLPAWLQCAGSMFNALHLGPTLLTAVGIPVLIPRVLWLADQFVRLAPRGPKKQSAAARLFGLFRGTPKVDPEPLITPAKPLQPAAQGTSPSIVGRLRSALLSPGL